MTKKTVGYVELEWQCPNCGNRNSGTDLKCQTCGFPQPREIAFQQRPQDELIMEGELVERAQRGPDIHCPYCGTRNLAGTERCKQCGGELGEGQARDQGRVIGAFHPEAAPPIVCPNCGAENPATASKCASCGAVLDKPTPVAEAEPVPQAGTTSARPWLIPVVLAVVSLACLAVFFLSGRTSQQIGEVSGVQWERSIAVEALMPVQRETWQSQVPAGAQLGSCEQRLHHTSPEPEQDSVEVCGTPYVVDTGTGVGEVVEDCEYQVYRPWCRYSTVAWVAAQPFVLRGSGYDPQWPEVKLEEGQREGGRQEDLTVLFNADGEDYRYPVSDVTELAEFPVGSRWRLRVNALGGVVGVEPVP